MAANFVVDKDVLGRYQWHLKAANGNIIARSEQAYPNRLWPTRRSSRLRPTHLMPR
jgi:hypothetical protein